MPLNPKPLGLQEAVWRDHHIGEDRRKTTMLVKQGGGDIAMSVKPEAGDIIEVRR